ncbi:hypothetical protein [Streptomyces sp. NPDC017435]|uniref:hypothetical protein n=1 Tax=Streptomyces sp. NPDC017435 TaxID=3364995 RepID=UPI0037993045
MNPPAPVTAAAQHRLRLLMDGLLVVGLAVSAVSTTPTAGSGSTRRRTYLEKNAAAVCGPVRACGAVLRGGPGRRYTPTPVGGRRMVAAFEPAREEWRRQYPLFPRLLFVLDGTGPAGVETRVRALRAAARAVDVVGFVREVPVLAATLSDLLHHGPAADAWRPVQNLGLRMSWMDHPHP